MDKMSLGRKLAIVGLSLLAGCSSLRNSPEYLHTLEDIAVANQGTLFDGKGIEVDRKITEAQYKASVHDKDLTLRDKRLHLIVYETSNRDSQNNIVMLPYLGGYARKLEPISRAICEYGDNVFALDYQGHGLSSGERGRFSEEEIMQSIDCVVDFICKRSSGNIGLIGVSVGSDFGLNYLGYSSSRNDNRVKSAVIYSTTLFSEIDLSSKLDQRVSIVLGQISGFFVDILAPKYLSTNSIYNVGELYADKSRNKEVKKDRLFLHRYLSRSYFDHMRHKLRSDQFNRPILVVAPLKDKLIPFPYEIMVFNRLRSKRKNVELFIANGAHLDIEENPLVFAPVINNWFKATIQKR